MWAVGADGTILRGNGSSWTRTSSGPTQTINGAKVDFCRALQSYYGQWAAPGAPTNPTNHYRATLKVRTALWNPRTKTWVFNGPNQLQPPLAFVVRKVQFNVGGTLYVNSNQVEGLYVGTFTVDVQYP